MEHRIATRDDVPLLATLNRQLIEDEQSRNAMSLPELEARMSEWLAGDYTAVIFTDGASPAAYALFRRDAQREIFLRQLFVVRDRRRQGIGRRAFELLRREVFPVGARITLDVFVHNEGALAFWRELGLVDYAISLELRSGARLR